LLLDFEKKKSGLLRNNVSDEKVAGVPTYASDLQATMAENRENT
jgi:hypothetical protein